MSNTGQSKQAIRSRDHPLTTLCSFTLDDKDWADISKMVLSNELFFWPTSKGDPTSKATRVLGQVSKLLIPLVPAAC